MSSLSVHGKAPERFMETLPLAAPPCRSNPSRRTHNDTRTKACSWLRLVFFPVEECLRDSAFDMCFFLIFFLICLSTRIPFVQKLVQEFFNEGTQLFLSFLGGHSFSIAVGTR